MQYALTIVHQLYFYNFKELSMYKRIVMFTSLLLPNNIKTNEHIEQL